MYKTTKDLNVTTRGITWDIVGTSIDGKYGLVEMRFQTIAHREYFVRLVDLEREMTRYPLWTPNLEKRMSFTRRVNRGKIIDIYRVVGLNPFQFKNVSHIITRGVIRSFQALDWLAHPPGKPDYWVITKKALAEMPRYADKASNENRGEIPCIKVS